MRRRRISRISLLSSGASVNKSAAAAAAINSLGIVNPTAPSRSEASVRIVHETHKQPHRHNFWL